MAAVLPFLAFFILCNSLFFFFFRASRKYTFYKNLSEKKL
jgi:hypothetical protein